VPAELAGPLDRAVRTLYGVSWGQARAWITSGKVRVGDAVATDPTRRVAADVTLHFDERARRVSPRGAAGELTDDQVVHLDTHLLVLSKPAGISTIPYDDSDKDTLEARARASSLSHSSAHARSLLAACERSAWQRTSIPVGRCRSHTVDEVLLIFWPPGPLPRMNLSSTSDAAAPSAASLDRTCSFASIWVSLAANLSAGPEGSTSQSRAGLGPAAQTARLGRRFTWFFPA